MQKLKFKEWVEDYVDEDTEEIITVHRRELFTKESSPEEEQLLEYINEHLSEIDTETLFRLKDEIIWGSMDYYPIWEELNDRGCLGFPRKLIKDGVATLPEDMEEIPDDYFRGCELLKSVVFSKNLRCIGKGVFALCNSLVDVQIPDGVTCIGEAAFEYCDNLKSVTIPNTVISIGNDAFCNCESLESIYIPDNVIEIGYHAFSDCHNLKSAYIGKGVKELKCHTFGRCYNLELVNLSVGIESINSCVFESCWRLRFLEIPSSVKSISNMAFEDCFFLTGKYINNSDVRGNFGEVVADVIQEDGLMIKDNHVFNCWRTDSVTIPRNVTIIEEYAFAEAGIKEFYYAGTIQEWKIVLCEYEGLKVIHCIDGDIELG